MRRSRHLRLTERQQVGLILCGAALAALALWLVLAICLAGRKAALDASLDETTRRLAQYEAPAGQPSLARQLAEEKRRSERLRIEWAQVSTYLSTFRPHGVPGRGALDEAPDHIDFKVALFDARRNLLQEAAEKKIALPPDLGIDEVVDSTKDPRGLMLQLATVEKLVRLLIELGIPTIASIQPMPGRTHAFGIGAQPGQAAGSGPERAAAEDVRELFQEYPVRLKLQCRLRELERLIETVSEPAHFFAFRQIRMSKSSMELPDALDVTAVLSAFVFPRDTTSLDPPGPGGAASEGGPTARRGRPEPDAGAPE